MMIFCVIGKGRAGEQQHLLTIPINHIFLRARQSIKKGIKIACCCSKIFLDVYKTKYGPFERNGIEILIPDAACCYRGGFMNNYYSSICGQIEMAI